MGTSPSLEATETPSNGTMKLTCLALFLALGLVSGKPEMDIQDVATPEDIIPEDRAACRNLIPDGNCNRWKNPHCFRGRSVSWMAKNCKKTCNKCSSGGSGNSAAAAVVKAHNDERAKYYSGYKVSWSTALASKAEKINRERGCDFQHSPSSRRRAGENLYWYSRSNVSQNVAFVR